MAASKVPIPLVFESRGRSVNLESASLWGGEIELRIVGVVVRLSGPARVIEETIRDPAADEDPRTASG